MGALRSLPSSGGPLARFWLCGLCAAFAPTSIGYQDLAAFLARQPGISERWREHLIASPFGTIHAATFSFVRPIGTAMPRPYAAEPVSFDPRSLDVKTWSLDAPPQARPAVEIAYPAVNRALKGDRLPLPQAAPAAAEPESLPQLQPISAPPAPQPAEPSAPVTAPRRPKDADAGGAAQSAALPDKDDAAENADAEDVALSDKPPDIIVAGESEPLEAAPSSFDTLSFLNVDPAERNAQLYFGVSAMGSHAGLQQWTPGAEPVMVSPQVSSDIKLSALEGRTDSGAGESVAGKDDASRLQTPAERLGLLGRGRAKAEKCLADAVYFEARGEPLRGQEAVAQVVMNRVFSGYYPNNVCGVVYQNADRHLACQFTFACEGKDLSRIDEPDMWAQAKRIAKDTLDGKIWLAQVGHATHYHAYWVHPSWVHEMAKLYKLGVHTFYRPRAWGDGSDAPVWAAPSETGKADGGAKPAASKVPEAAASPPEPAAGKGAKTAKL
jgi:Cell Wall Hydrolase